MEFVAVVDADKDLDEMQEVFARQEEIVMGRARHVKDNGDDKENSNITVSAGSKRVADDTGDGTEGRKKAVLMEKGQI